MKQLIRYRFIFLFLFSGLFTACEEVIDLQLRDSEPVLVIEGRINNLDSEQIVLLSRLQPFDAVGGKDRVSGAEVFLNENNGAWRRAREISEGTYVVNNFKGKPGNVYGLRVEYAGESYQAQSAMPELVRIDSTGIIVNTFEDARRTPLVTYQDPPDIKNYYYYELKINDEAISSLFLYNDKYNDGKYVLQNLDDFSLELLFGDVVDIELRNIDEAAFNYWRGVQSQSGASASPGNPPSNLSNGALGYFSAYAANRVNFRID